MSQTERIHQIVSLLEASRHPVPIARLLDELEVSRATFKRDLDYLRDRLGAPIVWRRGEPGRPGGYLLEGVHDGPGFGLHGLWFNQSEIYALLSMHRLAASMQPGLLGEQSSSLLARITHLLGSADDDPQAILSYIRIVQSATRRRPSPWFETVARATLRRRRLDLAYYTRGRDATTQRQVSPQRLLHYRENWYLLAWCHSAADLRLFALDAMRDVRPLKTGARRVGEKRLANALGRGFGIFGGRASRRAVLRFSSEAARWIADEIWHPEQRLAHDGGALILEVPFTHPRELIMEILRHGESVEVIAPTDLRDAVRDQLQRSLSNYRG
ncbi:MAG: WYL domain-containing protein [Gammaproteobacteria bacterium]|nr:WYL domain-containing protein [Gammaproteobacteria bacterium]MCP5299177.1 WYL domain-containing protein [Chromatiaceae bacterium]